MKRNRVYDIAKGIAICLVVLGHSYSIEMPMLWFINAFHMPFFFVVSGMIYADKFQNGVSFHIGKMAQKLLIPYVVFETLFCVYLALFNKEGAFLQVFLDRIRWTFSLEGNNATWFLACMFVAETIFFIVLKYVKKTIVCVCVFTVIAVIGVIMPLPFLPVVLQRTMVYIGYLAIGYFGRPFLSKKSPISFLLIAVAVFSGLVLFDQYVHIPVVTPILSVIAAVIGSYCLIRISARLQRFHVADVFEFYGKDTLIVLCCHIFAIEAVRLLDHKVLGNSLAGLGIFEGFVLTAIVLMVMYPLIPLCNRFLWFLFGKKRKCIKD